MPNLIKKIWDHAHFKTELLRAVRHALSKALKPLQEAHNRSHPQGRSYVSNLAKHVEFSCLYLDMICEVLEAKQCQDRVQIEEAKSAQTFDMDQVYSLKNEVAQRLAKAVEMLEEATRIWASAVVDPTDLGTLLGLNVYGLDYLRGKADEMRLESEVWGFSIT